MMLLQESIHFFGNNVLRCSAISEKWNTMEKWNKERGYA